MQAKWKTSQCINQKLLLFLHLFSISSFRFPFFLRIGKKQFFYSYNNKFNQKTFAWWKETRKKTAFVFFFISFDSLKSALLLTLAKNHTRNGKSIIVMYYTVSHEYLLYIQLKPNNDSMNKFISFQKKILFVLFFWFRACMCVCVLSYYLWILYTVTSFYCLDPLASSLKIDQEANVINRSCVSYCVGCFAYVTGS